MTRPLRIAIAALTGPALLAVAVAAARAQPPKPITYVQPTGSGVWLGASVWVQFSEAMDPRSGSEALGIRPATPGRIIWSQDSRELEFRPDEPLAPETRYEVSIGTRLRNASGTPVLAEPYNWTFSTGRASGGIAFSYAVPVQLVTLAGGRGVPVQLGYPRLTLDCELYRLDMPAFAPRYGALRPYESPRQAIDVTGLALVRRWRAYADATDRAAEIDLPSDIASGIYVLSASHRHAGAAQTFLIYSDYALTAKRGRADTTVWVTRVPGGEPAAGASVMLYDERGAPLGSATTDASGNAHFYGLSGAAFATAQQAGQVTLAGIDNYFCSDFENCGRWWEGIRQANAGVSLEAHIHTDRPIYRPGHPVRYKATLRRFERDGYSVLAPGTAVTVTIKDAAANRVATVPTTTDEFGSLAGELQLGDDVALGEWRIEAVVGRQTFTGYFQVQEYVKPDFEVQVTTDRSFYVRGGTAVVTVRGDYYFGQPAAGAEVTLRVFRGRYSYYSRSGQQVGEHRGVLDADGAWSVSVPLTLQGDTSESYSFEAEVMDATRRPVVGQVSVPVHPAQFALSMHLNRCGVPKGQPIVFTVVTMGHDGTPAIGRQVDIALYRHDRGFERESHRQTVTTGLDGKAEVALANVAEGWYSLRATAVDDADNRLQARSYAWVYDQARPWYWRGGLEVTADRDSYEPGDTAHLLIRSPVTTTALVTLERDNVYDEIVVPVSGATTVDVPIKAEYAPGVQAKVHLWQPQDYPYNRAEARMLTGKVILLVPAADRRLSVEVVPDGERHAPGEEATFTVRVSDPAGRPVRAQLSFAVVDKAVLALAADRSGDIFDAFWSARPATVSTHDSLTPSQWYVSQLRDRGPAAGPTPLPTGTATAAPAPTAEPGEPEAGQATPRRYFPDTAYWKADLVTDANGEATVTLTLPDTLTTWQALARAIALDTKAGQGKGELVVTKAVIAEPAMPRFAVRGDQFALDVLGRNYAGGTLEATVGLDTPGLVQLDAGDKGLVLPFNETRFARWTVVASALGRDTVTARLSTAAGDDAIELPFEVQPFAVGDRFARSGATTTSAVEPLVVPFHAIPESSRVEVNLTSGVALGIIDGVEDLIGYPYGCIEQTMSRMMPNAVVNRLVMELDIQAPEILAALPPMVAKGLQKIYSYQHSDGSWGYWSGGQNAYITAYVLQGLVLLEQNGYAVERSVIDRGFSWLAANTDREPDVRIRAYAAYVMATSGRGDAEALLELFRRRSELDAFGMAALAIALGKLGRLDLAEKALDELEAMAVETTPSTARWPLDVPDPWRWDSYHWRTMASTDKYTAMALEALALLRPQSRLAPKAARWLMENRHGYYGGYGRGWSSPQATSFAVLALTDYIVATGELWAEYDWSVRLDGQLVASGHFDATNNRRRLPPVVLSGEDLTPGEHELVIAKQGNGTLYYTVVGRLALYYDGFEPIAAEGFGLQLSRAYTPIEGRSGPGGWKVGDVVNVRLTLTTTDDLHYMILEDMLPAGLEALNDSLKTETSRVPSQPGGWWRWRGYERKEVRDDRVNFFATYLAAGTHTFDYPARAVTPGVFSARPAEAYAMYRPEVWGRSASDRVTVDDRQIAVRPPLAGDFDRDCRLTSFDASLVAAQWPDGGERDVNSDRRVDVADIAVASGRRGLVCGDQVPLPPGQVGQVDLELHMPDRLEVGQSFGLEILLSGSGRVGGYDVTLGLPAGAFEVLGAAAGDLLPGARLLSPVVTSDGLRFGAFDLDGAELAGRVVLARLTLSPRQSGVAAPVVTRAQVVTERGGEYRVTADGAVVSPAPWSPRGRVYLPSAVRDWAAP